MATRSECKVITDMNVREHFQQTVNRALLNQQVDATEDTVFYVVNLLTTFTDSQHFYIRSSEGLQLQPLANLYAEAVADVSPEERDRALKRMGDIALFVSGVFADSLSRKLVDVDYYIAMGGNAYSYLSDSCRNRRQGQFYGLVFGELSIKFSEFVDVLAEVSEVSNLSSSRDLLRLYELWHKTNSRRAARLLRKFGIDPIGQGKALQH